MCWATKASTSHIVVVVVITPSCLLDIPQVEMPVMGGAIQALDQNEFPVLSLAGASGSYIRRRHGYIIMVIHMHVTGNAYQMLYVVCHVLSTHFLHN